MTGQKDAYKDDIGYRGLEHICDYCHCQVDWMLMCLHCGKYSCYDCGVRHMFECPQFKTEHLRDVKRTRRA